MGWDGRKPRSMFSIVEVCPEKVFLVDLDSEDCMSVTNDAERVVSFINTMYPNRRIIYRASDKYWTELVHEGDRFVDYRPYARKPSDDIPNEDF